MSQKQIILLTIFVDVLGLSIIIPILPFYVESFGVSTSVVTLLFSIFALCSFVSAPFLGSLSDKIGRRPVLLISIASTAIGWLVFASAQNIFILFLARIIDGLAAGNMPIAQSYIADLSKDEKERTANLGLVGAIFGTAFVIGPAIGAFLSSYSHSLPFWTVGILATANFILAYFRLPETHHNRDLEKIITRNPLKPIINSFRDRKLFSYYLIWFIFGLALASQQSIFALYLQKVFGYDATATSIFLTTVGLIMIVNQGFLLKNFWLKFFPEKKLAPTLLMFFGFAYILMSTPNIYVFEISLFIMVLCQSVLRVILTSLAINNEQKRRGEILGILSSLLSLSMVFGPLVAGFFFEINPHIPFIVSGSLSIAAMIMLLITFRRQETSEPTAREKSESVEAVEENSLL